LHMASYGEACQRTRRQLARIDIAEVGRGHDAMLLEIGERFLL
jgi:hypothetical protein